MRVPAVAVLLALASGASAAPAKLPAAPVPLVFTAGPSHPDAALTEALVYLESKVAADARPYVRFFWFGAVPDGYLERVLTLWRTYLQTVSTAAPLVRPVAVDGTAGRLWAVDIRAARWTADAFRAVAHRDLVFAEPNIDHRLAESLRRLIGVRQDPATLHAEAVVPGPWFLREILETEGRSNSYYDLLYAVERFGDGKAVVGLGPEPPLPKKLRWPGGVWPGDGRHYPEGAFIYTRETPEQTQAILRAREEWRQRKQSEASGPSPRNGFVAADFPRDFDDWAARWGIKEAEAFLAKQRLFVKNGEVVAGAKSDPQRGSYVAYQDRVIEFLPINTRAAGAVAMRTRDFLKTAGKTNLANLPREVALGEVEEDLGEHILTLPNGFQAVLLTGAAKEGRKRAEFGDARAVRSSLDPHDVVIRTQFSCTVCHGPEWGVIPPSNRKVRESLERATSLLAKYPDDREAIESFFVGWDANLEIWRTPLRVALFAVTASAAEPKGWTGARWAAETLAFRDWYDRPVGLNQAAAELGYPPLGVALAALLEGTETYDATALFLGAGVPRSVWDADLAPKLAIVLAFARQVDSGDLVYDVWCGELLRQAAQKRK